MKKLKRGFTLIELLAIIAIVIIALVVYYSGQKNSRNFYDDSNNTNR